jgi:hypothetical protein
MQLYCIFLRRVQHWFCVCVFVDGAETLSLINVAWHGCTQCAVCSFVGCCCLVFVDIALQLYPESVSLIREYFYYVLNVLFCECVRCPL